MVVGRYVNMIQIMFVVNSYGWFMFFSSHVFNCNICANCVCNKYNKKNHQPPPIPALSLSIMYSDDSDNNGTHIIITINDDLHHIIMCYIMP